MKRKKSEQSDAIPIEFPPAMDRQQWEDQCTNLAYNLVAQRLRNGTATSQETTYFLKIGSTRERYERKLLEVQTELAEAKAALLSNSKEDKNDYKEIMRALSRYQGTFND